MINVFSMTGCYDVSSCLHCHGHDTQALQHATTEFHAIVIGCSRGRGRNGAIRSLNSWSSVGRSFNFGFWYEIYNITFLNYFTVVRNSNGVFSPSRASGRRNVRASCHCIVDLSFDNDGYTSYWTDSNLPLSFFTFANSPIAACAFRRDSCSSNDKCFFHNRILVFKRGRETW